MFNVNFLGVQLDTTACTMTLPAKKLAELLDQLLEFQNKKRASKRQLHTGTRGDVFVVRTSKSIENLWKKWVILIALHFRYTFYSANQETEGSHDRLTFFTRHFLPRSPFGRRAVRQRGYGLRLLIFKMANNKVDHVNACFQTSNRPLPFLLHIQVFTKLPSRSGSDKKRTNRLR